MLQRNSLTYRKRFLCCRGTRQHIVKGFYVAEELTNISYKCFYVAEELANISYKVFMLQQLTVVIPFSLYQKGYSFMFVFIDINYLCLVS